MLTPESSSPIQTGSSGHKRSGLVVALSIGAIVVVSVILGGFIYLQQGEIAKLERNNNQLIFNPVLPSSTTDDLPVTETTPTTTPSAFSTYKGVVTFSYPSDFGTLTPEKEATENLAPGTLPLSSYGAYSFTASNTDIESIIYDKAANTIAWVEKGAAYTRPAQCKVSGGAADVINHQQVAKILTRDKQVRTVFETDKTISGCIDGGSIAAMRISPDAAYVALTEYFWEGADSALVSVENSIDILQQDVYINPYGGIAWADGGSTIAFVSYSNEMMGGGKDALWVSEQGAPAKLTRVFTLDDAKATEGDLNGIRFIDKSSVEFSYYFYGNDGGKKLADTYMYSYLTKKTTVSAK